MTTRLLGLLIVMFSIGHASSIAGADSSTIDPAVLECLRTLAISDWQAAEREFPSIDVTFVYTQEEIPPGKSIISNRQTFRLAVNSDRSLVLLRTQSDNHVGAIAHDVINSRYSFTAYSPGSKTRSSLEKLQIASDAENLEKRRMPMSHLYWKMLQSESHLFAMPLEDLMNTEDFNPLRAIFIDGPGGKNIHFSATYIGGQAPHRIRNAVYSVVLDPKHRFRIISAALDRPSDSRKFSFSYHDSDNIHVPKEIVSECKEGASSITHQVYEIELPKPFHLADEEFYLPHYGISEAVLETLNPNPWPRWLLIGFGIVTIAIGAWLVRGGRQPTA